MGLIERPQRNLDYGVIVTPVLGQKIMLAVERICENKVNSAQSSLDEK